MKHTHYFFRTCPAFVIGDTWSTIQEVVDCPHCDPLHRGASQQSVQPTAFGVGWRARLGNWLIRLGESLIQNGGG